MYATYIYTGCPNKFKLRVTEAQQMKNVRTKLMSENASLKRALNDSWTKFVLQFVVQNRVRITTSQ